MAILLGDTAQTYWQRVSLMKSLMRAQIVVPRYWYEMLEAYYLNNSLYDDVQAALAENAIWTPGMKPLRNPVNRAVEFHVSKLWPGPLPAALPIVTKNKRIIPVIEKIWEWSNWGTQKQVMSRQLAGLGDTFIKVAEKSENNEVTRVYLDPIRPANVTTFDLDERGFLTYIRIDVPAGEQVHTEVWSKTWGGVRIWLHDYGLDKAIEELGTPTQSMGFEDLQFDFIPIVHAKFRDIGNARGAPAFAHVLDKIDEANRQATRLHQLLFRYNKPAIAVLANDVDTAGRPLPPPVVEGMDNTSTSDSDSVNIEDSDIWSMPGRSKVEYLVAQLRYDDALKILNAQMEEISKDLPEVLYYELRDQGDISGVALRTLLGAAIDRVVEARGNAEPSLVRAHQMAITIARIHELVDDVGTFEAGDLVHYFAERDVIARTNSEKAEVVQKETASGIPLTTSMKHNGYVESEIKDMIASQEYKIMMMERVVKILKEAEGTDIPAETILAHLGWTKEMLQEMGTQRLARIALEQEDIIPETEQ